MSKITEVSRLPRKYGVRVNTTSEYTRKVQGILVFNLDCFGLSTFSFLILLAAFNLLKIITLTTSSFSVHNEIWREKMSII